MHKLPRLVVAIAASLSLTVAPELRDGADAPFSVDLPAIPVGP